MKVFFLTWAVEEERGVFFLRPCQYIFSFNILIHTIPLLTDPMKGSLSTLTKPFSQFQETKPIAPWGPKTNHFSLKRPQKGPKCFVSTIGTPPQEDSGLKLSQNQAGHSSFMGQSEGVARWAKWRVSTAIVHCHLCCPSKREPIPVQR